MPKKKLANDSCVYFDLEKWLFEGKYYYANVIIMIIFLDSSSSSVNIIFKASSYLSLVIVRNIFFLYFFGSIIFTVRLSVARDSSLSYLFNILIHQTSFWIIRLTRFKITVIVIKFRWLIAFCLSENYEFFELANKLFKLWERTSGNDGIFRITRILETFVS